MFTPDPKALQVTRTVQNEQQPDLTILFGSRARGDQNEASSDIDIMLVQDLKPNDGEADIASAKAEAAAKSIYGRYVPVHLVWRTKKEYRYNRRYSNSAETNAARQGVLMPRDPESYSAYDFEDEETEYEYQWTTYDERLRHAEIHLLGFANHIDQGMDDLLIGQEGQRSLEFAMKALLEAHQAQYQGTHNIGHFLGAIRHNDPGMEEFGLSIPPDVYTAYDGGHQYVRRTQPLLTSFPDYRERTTTDAQTIISRARQIRAQRGVEENL